MVRLASRFRLKKNSRIYRSATSSLNRMAIINLIIILTACFFTRVIFSNGRSRLLPYFQHDCKIKVMSHLFICYEIITDNVITAYFLRYNVAIESY